jgi:hypothetical protein
LNASKSWLMSGIRTIWGLDERELLRDVATDLRSYQREFGNLPDWRQSPEWRRPQ